MKILTFLLFPALLFAEKIDQVVAVVNNEIILESDYSRLEKKLNNPLLIEEVLLQGKSIADLKKNRQVKTDYLISEKVLDSEVKRLNLTATPDRVDQEIKEMAQRYKTTPDEILKGARAEMGFTTEEYRKFLKTQIERQNLLQSEISSKVRVSDEEVYEEYKKRNPKHKAALSEVTLAHIFINPKKGGAEKAQERASRALERLRGGEKFEVVAEQMSEDPDFNNNGLLGTFKSGELVPEFENAVENLKKGDISNVVASKRGLHILKVLDQKTVKDSEFEKQKEKLRSQLMERSFERQFGLWIRAKKEDSTITFYDKK